MNDVDPLSFGCFLAAMMDRLRDVDRQVSEYLCENQRIQDLADRLDEANKRLEELVVTDPLTGVGNRRFFNDRFDVKLSEAERGRPLSLMIIDVDNFKLYNDTYGHQDGDQALKSIASVCFNAVRKADCFARYGGEEFVLASSVNAEGAVVLADKLLSSVRNITDVKSSISISIGLAEYRPFDDAITMVRRADSALYKAKSAGRNRVFSDLSL